jgi:hypothetical protein
VTKDDEKEIKLLQATYRQLVLELQNMPLGFGMPLNEKRRTEINDGCAQLQKRILKLQLGESVEVLVPRTRA